MPNKFYWQSRNADRVLRHFRRQCRLVYFSSFDPDVTERQRHFDLPSSPFQPSSAYWSTWQHFSTNRVSLTHPNKKLYTQARPQTEFYTKCLQDTFCQLRASRAPEKPSTFWNSVVSYQIYYCKTVKTVYSILSQTSLLRSERVSFAGSCFECKQHERGSDWLERGNDV